MQRPQHNHGCTLLVDAKFCQRATRRFDVAARFELEPAIVHGTRDSDDGIRSPSRNIERSQRRRTRFSDSSGAGRQVRKRREPGGYSFAQQLRDPMRDQRLRAAALHLIAEKSAQRSVEAIERAWNAQSSLQVRKFAETALREMGIDSGRLRIQIEQLSQFRQ